jgi:hypothetical protein
VGFRLGALVGADFLLDEEGGRPEDGHEGDTEEEAGVEEHSKHLKEEGSPPREEDQDEEDKEAAAAPRFFVSAILDRAHGVVRCSPREEVEGKGEIIHPDRMLVKMVLFC